MDFAQMGIIPGGTYRNQDYFASRVAMDEGLPDAMPELLYDPQTAGGLLVSLPEDDARTLCGRLEAEGRLAVVIGRVEELGAHAVTVRP
jgi:selenide,water dikinase